MVLVLVPVLLRFPILVLVWHQVWSSSAMWSGSGPPPELVPSPDTALVLVLVLAPSADSSLLTVAAVLLIPV